MKLVLDSGRVVTMSELRQHRTYAGVLAGKPGRRMNEDLVKDVAESARSSTPGGAEPVLLVPGQELMDSRLPGVACVAVFDSGELQGGREPYSSLAFAWWQAEFGGHLPIEVQRAIKAVDWERRAGEWCP